MKTVILVVTAVMGNGMELPPQINPPSFNTVQRCLHQRDLMRENFQLQLDSGAVKSFAIECQNSSGSNVYEWKDVPESQRRGNE